MAITIQNESRKIALSAEQLGSLSTKYKDFLAKQNVNATPVNNGTNVDAVEQIVNQSSPVVPQEESLITDAPVNQTTVDTPTVTPTVENPSIVIPEGPEVQQSVEVPTENVVASQPIVEQPQPVVQQTQPVQEVTNNASQEVNLEELKKQLLEDYYDLQLHVQEVGVKLEEMLEKIKNLPLTKEQNITNTPSENITTPLVQEKTEQVFQTPAPTQEQPPMENMFNNKPEEPLVQNQAQTPVQNPIPENVNIFDQGVNIFDQVPQNPSNGGQLKM